MVTGILAKPGCLGVPSGKLRGEEQNGTDLVVGLGFFVEGEENYNIFGRNEREHASTLSGLDPSCLFRNTWWEKTHSTPSVSPGPLPPTMLVPERSWTILGSTPTSWSHRRRVRLGMLETSFSSILMICSCCGRGPQRQTSDDRAIKLQELPVCTIICWDCQGCNASAGSFDLGIPKKPAGEASKPVFHTQSRRRGVY